MRWLLSLVFVASAASATITQEPRGKTESVLSSPDTFPIAVWLQNPRNAARYKELGINLYVGLWQGPTEAQLDALEKADMPVICDQNDTAMKNKTRKIIVAWMHGDEPDNAQSLGNGKGYGPPVPPANIVADYQKLKQADPSRPVILNLGQGVAWDRWYGRGVRTNKPEDYPQYIKGCDIVSFDIYPASHDRAEVAGNLWFVAQGVDRLRKWSDGLKPVWACIECTRISNLNRKPTPWQVRAEVWMALVHGANGLIYFSHQFKPTFIEAGMLADDEMSKAIAAINRQIQQLAPVLNSPTLHDQASATSSESAVPIDILVKRPGADTYLFALAMRDAATRGAFAVKGLKGKGTAQVLGEDRTLDVVDGRWEDSFKGYEVHLYRIAGQQ